MKIDVKAMSLREKIGQTMMIQNPEEYVERFGSVEAFLEKYPVGAVYLGSEPAGGPIGESKADSEVMEEFKRCSKYPLLIGGECNNWEEDGQWFAMPKQMALGAADDAELAHQWGRVLGDAARKGGRHWIFGPVADLNLNPDNPVINVRSLCDDPELTERLLTRVVEGIQSCGVAATAKHFPGHGTEGIDPHVARCSITQTREEWESTYGRAFGSLIECGLASVMTAHAALECYQSREEENEGLYKVATLSRDITTGLLKEKMNFKGVVVTDGLIMGGFSGSNTDLEIESFLCGSDVLLWPSLEYMVSNPMWVREPWGSKPSGERMWSASVSRIPEWDLPRKRWKKLIVRLERQ